MYKDARSTCRAIVLIIAPFVFFKMSLTFRDNFVFVKKCFKTCPLVRIGPTVTSYFLQVKPVMPVIYIEDNTWLRGDMKFIFECSTRVCLLFIYLFIYLFMCGYHFYPHMCDTIFLDLLPLAIALQFI